MNKLCCICKVSKPLSEFSDHKHRKDGKQSQCKECHKTYRRKHYLKNKQKYINKAKKWSNIRKLQLAKDMVHYFLEHPCVDCGEKDPLKLQFDHVRGSKSYDISYMKCSLCLPWKEILKEISKCDVRCASCHMKKTSIERNTYLYRALK